MMPAKGQNSSRRKGKEIFSDAPIVRDVGEEVMYSESDHSNEEEARRAPDGECAPLIDPWYDTHAHFLKVPIDYTHRSRAMCGLLFVVATQTFLRLRWLPRFLTFPSIKALHSPCPFSSNLGRHGLGLEGMGG